MRPALVWSCVMTAVVSRYEFLDISTVCNVIETIMGVVCGFNNIGIIIRYAPIIP